jgi:hypothetical protein
MEALVVVRRPICHGQLWLQLFGDEEDESPENENEAENQESEQDQARDQILYLSFN